MPLPMPLEPPITSTCLPLKSSSFIPMVLLVVFYFEPSSRNLTIKIWS
jgi:hypothetical protein